MRVQEEHYVFNRFGVNANRWNIFAVAGLLFVLAAGFSVGLDFGTFSFVRNDFVNVSAIEDVK